jgi:hypothetical protein
LAARFPKILKLKGTQNDITITQCKAWANARILNPATAAVVGIGLGLLWLLRDDEQATVDVPIETASSAGDCR